MENETLEQYAEQWANEITENKLTHFSRDNQPSDESLPLIKRILWERGDNIEFLRDRHKNLGIIWRTTPDAEQDVTIGEAW